MNETVPIDWKVGASANKTIAVTERIFILDKTLPTPTYTFKKKNFLLKISPALSIPIPSTDI